jgi:Fibronectin type III domain
MIEAPIHSPKRSLRTNLVSPKISRLGKKLVGLASVGLASYAFSAPSYTFIDLSKIGINATALSNTGMVVGSSSTSAAGVTYNPVNGILTDVSVPTSGAANFTGVMRVNTAGQLLGSSRVIVAPRVQYVFATLRNPDGSAVQALVLPTDRATYGIDINDSGQMLMTNSLPLCNPGVVCDFTNQKQYYYPKYLWTSAGGAKLLPKMGYVGQVTSINNLGQISGYTSGLPGDPEHAVVATQTTVKDLHTKNMGLRSYALKINDQGYAVGSAIALGGGLDQAVSWNTAAGTSTSYGTPNTLSQLTDINANGEFIGWEDPTPVSLSASHASYAVVGNVNSTGLSNLNTLVTGLPANLKIYNALDINDAGQILVSAYDSNTNLEYGALLLNPTVSTAIPTAPSGLLALAASSTQINLQWTDNANNETAQYLERCTGVGCTAYAQIAALGANLTSYTDNSVAAATTYGYRLRAHGSTGDSAYTNSASATTPAIIAGAVPAAPTSLTQVAITRNSIILTWIDNANDEQNYLVERCRGAGCTNFSQVASLGANTAMYSNANLRSNTTYQYRVRASNSVGKSNYSNALTVTTLR